MPSDKDWQDLVEVVSPVAEQVNNEYVEEQAEGEEAPEDSTEEQETAKKEEEVTPAKEFSKEDVERIVKDRLQREKESAQRREAEAARKAAEEAAEKNAEFETLAQQRKERIDELEARMAEYEALEETHSAYRETLDGYAESRISELNLPKGVTTLLGKMDPKEKLDWLSENESDFATTERVPAAEQPDETGTPEADEAARQAYQREFARDF